MRWCPVFLLPLFSLTAGQVVQQSINGGFQIQQQHQQQQVRNSQGGRQQQQLQQQLGQGQGLPLDESIIPQHQQQKVDSVPKNLKFESQQLRQSNKVHQANPSFNPAPAESNQHQLPPGYKRVENRNVQEINAKTKSGDSKQQNPSLHMNKDGGHVPQTRAPLPLNVDTVDSVEKVNNLMRVKALETRLKNVSKHDVAKLDGQVDNNNNLLDNIQNVKVPTRKPTPAPLKAPTKRPVNVNDKQLLPGSYEAKKLSQAKGQGIPAKHQADMNLYPESPQKDVKKDLLVKDSELPIVGGAGEIDRQNNMAHKPVVAPLHQAPDFMDVKAGGVEDTGGEDQEYEEEDEDLDDEAYEDTQLSNQNGIKEVEKNAAAIDSNIQPPQPKVVPIRGNVQNSNNEMRNEIPPVNHQRGNDEVNRPGSMKVVWDWSDFAVNFEQYVMPEQKIRRAPHSTTGEPWPMPQYYVAKKDKVFKISKSDFHFKLSKVKCDIIEKALERYKVYILEDSVEDVYDNFQNAQSTQFEDPGLKYEKELYTEAPVISIVSMKIRKTCAKYPSEKMDESYDLFVKRTGIYLWANEVWGALRGLETLSQLVYKGTDQELYIKDTVVNDYPRFSHRGVLIDSSRHFIFKEVIYDVLDGMAQNKMNVLHWHIVDDQSFPYQSKVYPDLSGKGAFHPTFVYTQEDIADIIEFARYRGIRVEPEFDTPGHTYSWGLSRPDLLTQCYQGDRPVDGYLGPMDPSKNETFRFLKTFFNEVLHTFKDQYIHLGGDEVPMTCWSSNPEITKFLSALQNKEDTQARVSDPYYYSYDIRQVLEYYVTRLTADLKNLGQKRSNDVRFVFWQEIMNNNVKLPNDTIIQVWQGDMGDIQRATSLGYNVIYSTCWYLDLIEYGTKWSKYYLCDPVDTTYGYALDESKILGGEACLWAEYIDNENLLTTLWPRASATAERLWSNKELRDLDTAGARLQEHRCRMLSRGLSVSQISGPDYCLRRGKRRHYMNGTANTNCTLAQCMVHNEMNRVEVEKINVEFQQKGGGIPDCSQAVIHAGTHFGIFMFLIVVLLIILTLKITNRKIFQVRMCRNKTILLVFVTLILVYFMCYTSIWMQAMEFKGSFEKRISSNVLDANRN